jgi:hypothetical protein
MRDDQTEGEVLVMDYREPLRTRAADHRLEAVAPIADERLRRRRSPWTSPDRTRPDHRGHLLLIATLVALGGSTYLGLMLFRAATDWLQHQKEYQVPFKRIQLVPKPPPWYRGSTEAFLASVRSDANESQQLSVLSWEPGRIKSAFLRNPWVESVVRVSYLPHGLRVELQYREPVALVVIPPAGQYLLDEKATILPIQDVDVDRLVRLGTMIRISGQEGLTDPSDPRPGKSWEPKPGVVDLSEGNGRIKAATKLASFLVHKTRALGRSQPPALHIPDIIPTDRKSRGLFMLNAEKTAILWGEAPGDEQPGKLSAQEKWAMLQEWSGRTKKRSDLTPGYWEFTREGLRHVTINRPDSP